MRTKSIPTDFAKCVTRFLTIHLPGERNLSPQTIKSYSFALKMYIGYLDSSAGIKPERIELKDILAGSIMGFLASMGESSPKTHNQRLSALKTFVRYAMLEYPIFILDGQRILAIPSKRSSENEIIYLEKDAMKALLATPDQKNVRGRRDLAIMALLYDTGARVQELINLKVKNMRLVKPETVTLFGKRRKMRTIPIMPETARILEVYMRDRGFLEQSACGDLYLFNSMNRAQFTRPGISKILKRHFLIAKQANSSVPFPNDIHPHAFRASKAIHLLESGVNIIAIRDFLGHTSVSTTQVYLRVNSQAKREAIVQAYPSLAESVPAWQENCDLMKLLNQMCS
ncbi:tyrosine-type recombinase/integrase [Anoxynatronum buryatiense]|uniref:Site-specific recombinase XerD n=1 Tax=Anoxynatronum buryatiense TaxID=489973 RepID=A0AA46AK66_9CLOT|nr:tyrosine-type recombinase/integrase [Anoxynatronum buryatiense]SMP68108.1 Site-specific recombinase XerD [Anoxynatronum buryatiense]